ncbi:MAG TPA: anhydro-N-acetylmuramic acid kinase [Anaerolineales bacterium]|nr:anhydro-N-acetylmuramic acid kinase [Anaerolineales bacterium]
MIVIGLMSGTSADGVDAIVVRLEGIPPSLDWQVLGHSHRSFAPELRAEIFACFQPETSSVDRLCRLNFALGRALGSAVLEAAHDAGLSMREIGLIGSHGQTFWHEPPVGSEQGSTLQMGEAALIAEMTGVPVVSNFRTRDMAAGGQGAPLVPLADWLLLSHPTKIRAAQNIGGIANVTFLPPLGKNTEPQSELRVPRKEKGFPGTLHGANISNRGVFAFDTGPGNMLMDEAARLATDGVWNYDHEGVLAAQGDVNESLLTDWLAEPFFQQQPPRTTGRERFGTQRAAEYWSQANRRGLGANDIVATLTALTAHSIEHAYRTFLPAFPDEVIVSGGGARNHTLMALLAERLSPARVTTSEECGLGIEAKEAVAFAVLAYETWHKRPGNIPAATGASRAVVLGSITY